MTLRIEIKRDLHESKETYINLKRPISIKKDLHESKETYKRDLYESKET